MIGMSISFVASGLPSLALRIDLPDGKSVIARDPELFDGPG
jgi:hypothetical protein